MQKLHSGKALEWAWHREWGLAVNKVKTRAFKMIVFVSTPVIFLVQIYTVVNFSWVSSCCPLDHFIITNLRYSMWWANNWVQCALRNTKRLSNQCRIKVLYVSTFACTIPHCYSNTSTQNPSHQWCNVNCKYRQHTSSCRSTPARALSSSLTTSMWPPPLARVRAVLPSHCTREVEKGNCHRLSRTCHNHKHCYTLLVLPSVIVSSPDPAQEFLGLEPLL